MRERVRSPSVIFKMKADHSNLKKGFIVHPFETGDGNYSASYGDHNKTVKSFQSFLEAESYLINHDIRKIIYKHPEGTKKYIISQKAKEPRKPKKLPAYLSKEEYAKIISKVKSPHHKLAFNLAFNSGLRVSEVIKLKKEDIDISSRRIFIRDAKGGKDRVAPLPKGFPQSYLKYLPLKCGIRSLQIAFKRAVKRSGVHKSGVHFHSLRHSFAVRCVEIGVPLNQLQVMLGHSNLATTSIYTQINPKDALKSYEELW